jgi:glycosyltransferase involved in cell wall biosynthesis
VSRLLAENQYDVLLTNYWYTARKPIQRANIPTVCDTHDVVTEQLERHLALGDHLPWKRWAAARTLNRVRTREAETLNSHELLICVTDRDITTIRETLRVDVPSIAIATIREKTRLRYEIRTSDEEIILFFGALQSEMNKDAARYLAKELFPRIRTQRPLSRLIIAGSNANSKILELGEIEGVSLALHLAFEDLLVLMHRSRVTLLPLRVGSGIKGRVIEAMEAGIPVVGTSITAEGIPVTNGENMIVTDDPAKLVDWTVRLLSDESLRLRLSHNARQFVEKNYSWATTYGKIHHCLDMACANYEKGHMNEKAPRS